MSRDLCSLVVRVQFYALAAESALEREARAVRAGRLEEAARASEAAELFSRLAFDAVSGVLDGR